MASNPFDQFDNVAAPAGPAQPQPYTLGTPRQKEPYRFQNNAGDVVEIGPSGANTIYRDPSPKGQGGSPGITAEQRGKLKAQQGGAIGLLRRIEEVETRYRNDFAGGGISALAEYLPGQLRPENQQFNDASRSLIGDLAAAYGLTAQQQNTPTELEIRFGPFIPRAGDRDEVIQAKIARLKEVAASQLDQANRQLGEEAGEASGVPQSAPVASTSATAATPDRLDRTSQVYGPPSEDGRQSAGYGAEYRRENDPALAGVNARLGAMVVQGASDQEIRAYLSEVGVPASDTSIDAALAFRRTPEFRRWVQANPNTPYPVNIDDRLVPLSDSGRGWNNLANSPVGGYGAGVTNSVSLGAADEIFAGGEAFVDALQGEGSIGNLYDRNLADIRAKQDAIRENSPLSSIAGEVAGGFLLPSFGASGAGQLAKVGAGYGAAYGFNSAEGGITDRLLGAGLGAGLGGTLGGGFGLLGAHLRARRNPPNPDSSRTSPIELWEAGQRQGIDVMPADVGGPMTRRFTSGVAQTPFGSGPIVRAAERVNDKAGARLGEIAALEGAPVRQEALGDIARRGSQRYIDDSGAEGRKLYEAARSGSESVLARGKRAIAKIDENLTELQFTANVNAPEIAALHKLRSDLVRNEEPVGLPIDAIRRLRSGVRSMAQTEELRATDFQRRANQVLRELSVDIADSLPAASREAFRRADRQWAERLDVIDDVMRQILGRGDNRSAEAVAQRLIGMSRGDSARFRTFLGSVPAEEAGIVRGSVIQELGRATSGQQGAQGETFSLGTFLTNWDRLPERSRNALFRGESRAAIEDLAKVAEGAKASIRYANSSNTAGAANVSEIGRALSYGAGLSTVGASFVAENLTGRLLASPRFARFLVWAAREERPPGELARRLGRIANREPALSAEIIPIRDGLRQLTTSAAAEDVEDRR